MKYLILTLNILLFSLQISNAQSQSGKALFGIHSNTVSKSKAKKLGFEQPNGVYITNVIGNTAAEKNGFQRFDYITKVGDYELNENTHFSDVMDKFEVGDQAMINYVRRGEKLQKLVKFGDSNEARERNRSRNEDPFLGIEQNHTRKPNGVEGVSVDIVKHSTAEDLGLEDDDIITKIDDIPMIDWHDISAAIDNREVGELIRVTYYRDGNEDTNTLPIKSLAATKDQPHNTQQQTEEPMVTNDDEEELEVEEEELEMEIDMEDMPEEDAEQMERELGIKMPIVQNLSIEQLNIFPNPTQGLFNLKFELPEQGQTFIRIFDQRGVLIFSSDLGNFSGSYSESIDLGNQPAGTYFVMIRQDTFSVSKKVIISRN